MNRRNSHSAFFLLSLSLLAALLLAACSNPTETDPPDDPGGPGIIIPGESIDGVKLGFSREEVKEVLGEPSSVGWADGLYRSWLLYVFEDRFRIYFLESDTNEWGPVDALSVTNLYEGKTPSQIGLGSTLRDVVEEYGEPNIIRETSGEASFHYTYCNEGERFTTYRIEEEIVEGVFIGFFEPIEEDTTNTCS